ncbi:MAG TPA: energy transducer TonB [Dongiaceae bacterium]|nr:energy transducer TonB [Dongiaceae bacterium]
MTSSEGSILFSSLPQWKAPWSEFLLSYGAQAAVIGILVWIPVLHPEILEQPKRDYHAIELVPTPVPVNHAPQRRLPEPVLAAKLDPIEPPPSALRLPAPEPRPRPRVENAPQPEIKIATKPLEVIPSSAPMIPKTIKTGTFSTGSSAPQTIRSAPQQVQTGGFGDPNGVPARSTQTQAVNIAQAGGFDLPTGPGYGNGTGGANGLRGVVASTGFGGGVAVSPPRAAPGVVKQAGFTSADSPSASTAQSRPAQAVAPKIVPAEILSKPTPTYTDEARAKRIEGEVLLEVIFEASGKLRVVRIVRGLGHGLDDAAVRAAEQIRFKPALKDGQPSDSMAVVHIIFQLA